MPRLWYNRAVSRLTYSGASRRALFSTYKKYKGRCAGNMCRRKMPIDEAVLHKDSSELSNLQILCQKCSFAKKNVLLRNVMNKYGLRYT